MSEFNWSEKHIIVTGGAGFLGSHLVDYLGQLGAGDIIIPRSDEYDLRHEDAVARLFDDYPQADIMIHLAATVGGIGANAAHPGQYYFDNIMMGTLLMEYARRHNLEKFVSIGTICSYPKFTPIPFKEENIWDGYPEETNAPYGTAKRGLLVQGQAYRDEYDFNAIHLLPTNLYGPRDDFDPKTAHVIPDLIRKMTTAREDGTPVTLFGDGTPTREFLYVEDAARGIAMATAQYNDPAPVNLGSGMEISIKDLANLIAELVGFEGRIVWDTSKPNGQPRRNVDTTRAKERFGFEARTEFREGLQKMIAWYNANREQLETT